MRSIHVAVRYRKPAASKASIFVGFASLVVCAAAALCIPGRAFALTPTQGMKIPVGTAVGGACDTVWQTAADGAVLHTEQEGWGVATVSPRRVDTRAWRGKLLAPSSVPPVSVPPDGSWPIGNVPGNWAGLKSEFDWPNLDTPPFRLSGLWAWNFQGNGADLEPSEGIADNTCTAQYAS